MLKKLSKILLVGTTSLMLMAAVISPVDVFAGSERGTKKCFDDIDNDGDNLIDDADPDCADFTGGGDDTVDRRNLVRVQMADWVGAGISRDNLDVCPSSGGPTYDYWDHADSGLIDGEECTFHDIRSDASGGGRWFLMLPNYDPPSPNATRWLSVDFSSPDNTLCPDFEDNATVGNPGRVYTHGEGVPADDDPCVDNLAVWLEAHRALHKSASRTPVKIRLHQLGLGTDDFWRPFAFIEYIDPLYLRAPELTDVGFETGCPRVISTEPGSGDTTGPVRQAELREWASVFSGPLIGTYNLPFEACLTRVE